MNAGIILFLVFAICSVIGVPISISLGVGSLAAVIFGDLGVSPAVIAQRLFGGLQSTSIMAIAFFILAGNLMAGGGISRRIVNFANCLIGNIRGGMGVALVLACAFFAALSGSAPATVVAIGSMLYAEMVKDGYPEARTAGLLVVSGGLGPIIPPSIIMVLYCTLTGASVTNMFTEGLMIGIVIMLVLIVEVIFFCPQREVAEGTCQTQRKRNRQDLPQCNPRSSDSGHHPWRNLLRPADRNGECGRCLRLGTHCRRVYL